MHSYSRRHNRGGLNWLVFFIFIQPIFTAECPDKTGEARNSGSCTCGQKTCPANQYCMVGDTLSPVVQIDAARPGQIFYGVNGQCADTSGGPWYVGIVNGLCEDIPGRYTITSRSSCQDGFDTGLLASVGVRTRLVTTPVVPSFWGCNTKGDYKSHAACDDVYHLNYIVKTDDGLNPYITNYQIGCKLRRYDTSFTMEFGKRGRNDPAGDPLTSGWSSPRFTVCISAPVCSNVVS